ncbi:MAG TPA: heme A synthase, partial [Terrimesophilobacter sp.]|nr:heme A synthase [Terrimesophilobacter sp.]
MVERTGFDVELLQHVHAWPSYALGALTLVLGYIAVRQRLKVAGWVFMAIGLELIQIVVGLVQARNGLPEVLVGTHMVLAALLAAVFTVLVLRLREPLATKPLEPRSL